MEYIIQLIELASGENDPAAGQYVKEYDPAAHDGRGDLVTTPDKGIARRFPDMGAAMEYLRRPAGIRPDGKPNRPLLAWTTMILPTQA
jgi:hypothetical protein